jgi:1,4-alpha-glucan branching enzyme
MPGDDWQKFANLRLLYTYLVHAARQEAVVHGRRFADRNEWSYDRRCAGNNWSPLRIGGVHDLVAALNRLYRDDAAFALDFDAAGLQLDRLGRR